MTAPLTQAFDSWKARPAPETLVRLLEASRNTVYGLCHRVLRHPQDAEDASQTVFLQIIDQLRGIRDATHFGRWLHRACFHVALNLKRSRRRRLEHERRKAEYADAAIALPEDAADAIHEHIARLDDEARSLVVSHYLERKSVQDLAAGSGCSPVTLWKKLEKAREELLQALSRSGIAMTVPALESFLGSAPLLPAPPGLLGAPLLSKAASGAVALKSGSLVAAVLVAMAGTGLIVVGAVRRHPPEIVALDPSAAPRSAALGDPPSPAATATALIPSVREDVGHPSQAQKPTTVLASIVGFMKTQNKDGSWGDGLTTLNGQLLDPTGVTALALLTFLGAGYTEISKDAYDGHDAGHAVRQGLKWLHDRLRPDGTFITAGDLSLNQALATLALTEAYGMTAATAQREPAQKALDALLTLQAGNGSWGDDTASLWAAEALTSARVTGMTVDPDVLKRSQQYYRSQLDAGPNLPAMIGHIFLNRDVTHPSLARTSAWISAVTPEADRPDFMYCYMGSLALFHYSGPDGELWNQWSEPFLQALHSSQKDGFWPAGTQSGTIVQTSLATLALEVYYRYGNVSGGRRPEDK